MLSVSGASEDHVVSLFSPLVEAVWSGRLVHLDGIDIIGSTAGSLARLMQDREVELWEDKRIVRQASQEEVCPSTASRARRLSPS